MSVAEAYHVHLGFWTNWSYGKIEGATITLSRRNGNLLVAFIAIFVGATGKSFWRLACFILHRMLSSSRPQDGIYHQLQAILRNSDTAQDAAWSLGHVIWAWRVPARFRKPFPRLFSIIALALLVSISFGVAGVFSSQITSDTANEVLLKGDNCGPLRSNDDVDPVAYEVLFQPFQYKRATAYSSYALQCYSGEMSAAAEDCHPFVKAKLKTTVTRNATCPFSDKMCKVQNDNLIVDTGFLDSHDDLGINSAPANRFQLRMVHHCAPIVTKGFSNITRAENTTEDFSRYYYGAINENTNFTQEVSLNESNAFDSLKYVRSRPRADYGISVMKAYGGPLELSKEYSMFDPIDQLRRKDADTILFFLTAYGIKFTKAVDDPWFSAHREGPRLSSFRNNETMPTYLQDEPLSVMGCAMQMQFCNPNLPDDSRCEPLHGMIDDSYPVLDLYKTQSQKTGFQWAMDIIRLGMFSISGIVDSIGITSIIARHGLGSNSQGPLPTNQWQLEVENWVSASLVSIQGSFVETGNGPSPKYEQFRRAPNETEQYKMCENQKIVTTKYSSFSVLGVGLILVIGGLIMFLDLALEPIINYIEARRSKTRPNPSGTYARLEWNTNTTLQLQRLAHEHIGVGTWKSSGWDHPVTSPNEKLAMIDVSNEEHTVLVAPQDWEDKSTTEKPSTAGSDTISWRSEDHKPKKVDTFESVEDVGVRRADTFGSTDKRFRREDTKTTLVNEITSNDDMISPVPSLSRKGTDCQTPTSERGR